MKNLQMLYGIAAVLVVVLGIVGCNLLGPDVEQPTSPTSSSAELTPVGSAQIANFYVSPGVSDAYGVYIGGTSFVVNVPKPGIFLLTYYTMGGFGLSTYTIDQLRLKGVPADILAKLSLLVGKEFATEAEFLAGLANSIGDEALLTYRPLIVRYAFTRTGGPFYLVAKVKKNSLLYIGLLPGDMVLNAAINEGDLTTLATTTPDAQDFGTVTVLFRPGFIGHWMDYFIVNPSLPPIILISNYAIVISPNVIVLELPGNVSRRTQHFTKPKTH
jgi:hypothetical protein